MSSPEFRTGSRLPRVSRGLLLAGSVVLAGALAGCSSLGGVGPSTGAVKKADGRALLASTIKVVDVDGAITERLASRDVPKLFSDHLGEVAPTAGTIGRGDVVEIAIVEAPPAVLFNGGGDSALRNPLAASTVSSVTSSRGWNSPQQAVDVDGRITVPFVGSVAVVGRSPREIEREITARLQGKAHDPQVMVRRIANAASNVTVLGDVAQSGRFPLSAHGERLLEVIAAAGGPKQPLSKTVVQVTRGGQTLVLPMSAVTADTRQNVTLRPDDVVTVLFQPYSFTSLGASGSNSEVFFEGPGFTLANALGRIGGLQDTRSNVKGVFVFRFEEPDGLADGARGEGVPAGQASKVPVVYRIDLSDPATLFLVQKFPIRNGDVVYVSNAPLVDFSKFLGIVSSTIFSVAGVVNTVP